MALTTSLPCIDTLAFQLSRHGLDENRNVKQGFYYSWSEPFDLDFAGRVHSNPKRSRSLPSALVTKRREPTPLTANQTRLLGLKRAKENDENIEYACKAGVDIHSTSLYTSPGHLTLSVNKYANQSNRHGESSDRVTDSAEASDDEVSGFLINTPTNSDNLSHQVTNASQKLVHGKIQNPEFSTRKRNLDEHEYSSNKKRRRPRLNFEKMQLSRNVTVPVPKSDPSIFDKVYFRPIIQLNVND